MMGKVVLLFLLSGQILMTQDFSCEDSPPGTIWCDDFEDQRPMDEKYFEYNNDEGDCIVLDEVGRNNSRGLRIIWQKDEVSAGGFKKSFGKTPSSYIGKNSEYPDSSFDEIYWRMDIKQQDGWVGGGPAKLSRALTLANSNWATGMMAHVWSGGQNNLFLGMDPASGISKDGELMTTKYNDFENLRWLGYKAGEIEIFSTENSGKWYCIECHVKLNTPGKSDGVFELWINGEFQAGTYDLNWHGTWNNDPDNMMINSVFFENYWNGGSPVEQERYFDNIVISTQRIGCGTTKSVESENSSSIKLYPNPANDEIHIVKSMENLTIPENTNIKIYNSYGKLVLTKVVQYKEQDHRIDISNFNAGMYLIRIEQGSNQIDKKFIIID